MSTRTHLSIGEVLGLLTDDFPDLTITKIRFLESQGLIDPERTASGYRKFYDGDIERLRWILRQQRENFLPLKVIKDRLDRSEGKLPEDEESEEAAGQAELDLARDPGPADPPPVWMSDHAQASKAEATRSAPAETVPSEPAAPPPATATKNSTSEAGATPTGPEPLPATATAKSKPTAPAPKPPTKAKQAAPKPAVTATAPAADPANQSGRNMTSGDLSDVSMSRAELLGASGLTERQLTELESFHIVVANDDFDDAIYGAEALVCARQAATFLELGMEARHLRAFKVAADREAGFYEQLILPLLRQRNPAARAEATQVLERLAAAGASIHAALLQQSLRSQLRSRR